MVPEASRSPGLRLQPQTEWWISCCLAVQYRYCRIYHTHASLICMMSMWRPLRLGNAFPDPFFHSQEFGNGHFYSRGSSDKLIHPNKSYNHFTDISKPQFTMKYITKQIVSSIINRFRKILPSTVGLRQYFSNLGETMSNNDLNARHCLYDIPKMLHLSTCKWNEYNQHCCLPCSYCDRWSPACPAPQLTVTSSASSTDYIKLIVQTSLHPIQFMPCTFTFTIPMWLQCQKKLASALNG